MRHPSKQRKRGRRGDRRHTPRRQVVLPEQRATKTRRYSYGDYVVTWQDGNIVAAVIHTTNAVRAYGPLPKALRERADQFIDRKR